MATYHGQIDDYSCNILSPKVYGGKRLMNIGGSFGRAALWFKPQGSSLPDNKKRSGQNIFEIYYYIEDWDAIIDVLRNETPVFFTYRDTSNGAQIYTSSEPVGEEES